MRMAYDNTQFQIDEEANACNFLLMKIKNDTNPSVIINQVNYGYLTTKHRYLENTYISLIRPGDLGFLDIFHSSLNQNEYIFYNSNLGKEICKYEMTKEKFNSTLNEIIINNKIYDCGKTFIVNGESYK